MHIVFGFFVYSEEQSSSQPPLKDSIRPSSIRASLPISQLVFAVEVMVKRFRKNAGECDMTDTFTLRVYRRLDNRTEGLSISWRRLLALLSDSRKALA